MVEVALEEFEDFYKERLNSQFFKIKRALKKVLSDISSSLVDIKISMDHFQESASQKIDEKSLRSLNLFYDRVKGSIDDIKIPDEDDITYSNLNDLTNSIKKLFNTINEIARKSLPKFQKQVQSEIKELNYVTRKLGKKQAILDQFMRKKYGDVRSAEDLLNKLPKFYSLKENIENAKTDMDNFQKELNEKQETLNNLNSELLNLEKNELFKELETKKDDIFQLRIKINDQLGFKKALKKMKFELEKNNIHISNFDLNYLKEFLKNPIASLIKERTDLPNFKGTLVHLRHVLEENKLNLKTDTKEKTIEQINAIFDEKTIFDDLEKLKGLRNEIKEIQKEIETAGLAQKLEDIKNQISINTVKVEHIQADLERRNKDYLRNLSALKQERDDFQNLIEKVIEDEFKINISFEF
ncbi:MAG: hypothetical protein EU532_05860 [Promethearchaeota archaeon]|nr:MAG: hypothetical protein EU532_05860 [Candidatus Lokiarchaeota archaeon]